MSLLATFVLPALIASKSASVAEPSALTTLLTNRLPSLGHRNWIVVADSAYPLQTAPGIETIIVQDDQISAVRQVLDALKKTKHVKPTIFIDKELKFVTDKLSPGISRYRSNLDSLLKGKNPQQLLHEDIIAKLDEAGKTFKVLLIKTPHIQPYTSVFFQLECGYWTAESEAELRSRMQSGNSGG